MHHYLCPKNGGQVSIQKLLQKGYITRNQVSGFYPGRNETDKLIFEYYMIETYEGNGVLHILYFGDYIPQQWLSDNWAKIHQSKIVNIKEIRGDYKIKKIIKYIINHKEWKRSSYSRNWMGHNANKVWKIIRQEIKKKKERLDKYKPFLKGQILEIKGRSFSVI
jgi:hypothetical protein